MDLEKCPYCGAPVKQEHLARHYRKIHPNRGTASSGHRAFAEKRRPSRASHRKGLFAVLAVILLLAVAAYVFYPSLQSSGPQGSSNTSNAPITVTPSQSTMSIPGPGIVAFNLTIKPKEMLTSPVVLGVRNRPSDVRVVFDPSSLSLTQNSGTSRVTLVVRQEAPPASYQITLVASVGPDMTETTVRLQISSPTPTRHFYLLANSSGWNATQASGKNPRIEVQRGETFQLTLRTLPCDPVTNVCDIHHYISIYPSGTQPSQVDEFSSADYARSGLAHSYPETQTITFTSMVGGTLEYYCDFHAVAMHGVITVTG